MQIKVARRHTFLEILDVTLQHKINLEWRQIVELNDGRGSTSPFELWDWYLLQHCMDKYQFPLLTYSAGVIVSAAGRTAIHVCYRAWDGECNTHIRADILLDTIKSVWCHVIYDYFKLKSFCVFSIIHRLRICFWILILRLAIHNVSGWVDESHYIYFANLKSFCNVCILMLDDNWCLNFSMRL